MGQRLVSAVYFSDDGLPDLRIIIQNPLPEEIYIEILLFLDMISILNFGKSCRKAYQLTNHHFIWQKKLTAEFQGYPISGIKRENYKMDYLKLSLRFSWSTEFFCQGFLRVKDNVLENLLEQRNSASYVNARTDNSLLEGFVHEWVICYKKSNNCNHLVGVGVEDFDHYVDGDCDNSVGGSGRGGIGVLVGGSFDILYQGRYLLTRSAMDSKNGDQFWFRFDTRKKNECILFFARNNEKFLRVEPTLDLGKGRLFPHITIFNNGEVGFAIERKIRNFKDWKEYIDL